ncbi:helix-turn-helix domain-containing protein [Candidatus Falkowbacteria bacterium]|nr:helix-turn-helix domain-containing protein [Candidatus Falkowbacteria bacterium]
MPKNLKKFGSLLNKLRTQNNLSIREICKLVSYDPSNWSKIERALISPPSDDKTLKLWAKILKVKSEKVQEFMDDARIAQGIIPDDILNKTEMLELMPAFFRTVRNKKPSKEEIDRLINLIKNA